MLGLLRIKKNSTVARNTHNLEGAEVGLVRTWKEIKLARQTHFLEGAEVLIG